MERPQLCLKLVAGDLSLSKDRDRESTVWAEYLSLGSASPFPLELAAGAGVEEGIWLWSPLSAHRGQNYRDENPALSLCP